MPGTTNHEAGRPCPLAYVDLARPGFAPERLVAGLDDPAPAPPPPDERTLARWAEQNARDPAKQIPPPVYFRLLAGETVTERGGDVRCPLPDHPDENPSCRVYPTAEQGWCCHGCGRGGSIYDLASLLEGGPWGRALRDEQFKRIKDRGLAATRHRIRSAVAGATPSERAPTRARRREQQPQRGGEMTRYAGDPHWIEARHPGNCRSCGGPFARGERVFYWPRQRAVSCGVCGEVEARRFAAEAAEKELLGGSHGQER